MEDTEFLNNLINLLPNDIDYEADDEEDSIIRSDNDLIKNLQHFILDNSFKYFWINSKHTYTGDYKDEMYHGKGELKTSEGFYYKGNFRRGSFDGKGRIIYPDSSIYVGSLINNLPNGFGRLNRIIDDSTYVEYEGEFFNGLMSGIGTINTNYGKIYEGEFFNNFIDGVGILSLKNGDKYAGEFKMNTYHGHGEYFYNVNNFDITYPNLNRLNKRLSGHWKDGYLYDNSLIVYYDDTFYKGNVIRGLPHGDGTLYFKNRKIKYKGYFKYGLFEGEGNLFDREKNISYQGKFLSGEFNGEIIASNLNDNSVEISNYKNGIKHGLTTMLNSDHKIIKKYFYEGIELSESECNRDKKLLRESCPICQETFKRKDLITKLPCQHAFHCECMFVWLSNKESCPLCRTTEIFSNKKRRLDLIF